MESWILDLGLQRSIANARIALVSQYSLSFAMERNKPYFGRRLSAFQSPPVRYALMAALTRHVLKGKQAGRVLAIDLCNPKSDIHDSIKLFLLHSLDHEMDY